ncbi:hypothetical protein JDV02_001273 [Purpureocillium takamizusanense]|uniref:Uncharacterized protein n=1 Tax=Purpureocillium takamizusanense TaxID=2060973 RepID=A0A9Q8Q8U5_9HYPO|nr:uncharacterized protein JDV02_001273 [Purpureocillium takamizusanense]UNI14669.1 hypothetical protein JDV02_001273 [Purpureocillium takamizusanense]
MEVASPRNGDNGSGSGSSGGNRAAVRLPAELLLHVIECVLPGNSRALLPPWHSSTRTLLSLTRVSRATYGHASKLLRQRCVYVDSSVRLATLLQCIPRLVPTLPPVPALRNVTSLYLTPFGPSLDDQPTAVWVRELLCEVCETLRRLVVQMPFGSLDPLDDHLNVRRTLREGFEQLTGLDEFVCLGEYPALSLPEAPTDVWRLWPKLKRLALFGVPADSHWLWWDVATLPDLGHVVLARARRLGETNIKDEYFHKLPRGDERLGRRIRVVLLDAAWEVPELDTARWAEIDPEGRMTVEVHEVPVPFYGDETPQELVTGWVKRGALDGTLWEWRGERVGP